jgi:GDSL-like Lipase/Acylhydrolase family
MATEVNRSTASHCMPHLVLLGDSILDNGAYTGAGPDVIAQVKQRLPAGWRASLSAVDGATTAGIPAQLRALPAEATHLVLSVGGNDALRYMGLLGVRVRSSGEALLLLADAAQEFEHAYRTAVEACLKPGLPLVVCTIYHGSFPDPDFQRRAVVALTLFNDVILRVAIDRQLAVVDLRRICRSAADYANPIEPSSAGGAKIADALVRAVTAPVHAGRGAQIYGG